MGGQQFGTDMVLVDMRGLNQMVSLDSERGTLEVQAGAFWPGLIDAYIERQKGSPRQWGIAQKQTGADNLSIGGTLAANAHGRGLTMQPFVSNIRVIHPDRCGCQPRYMQSRTEHRTLPLGDRRLWSFWGGFFHNHTPRSKTED